jgi:hypothetical protein
MSSHRIISQITLLEREPGMFKVRIKHSSGMFRDEQSESAWCVDAGDAYRDAEAKLVVKPGYVSAIQQPLRADGVRILPRA